jgi:hypothetical protein
MLNELFCAEKMESEAMELWLELDLNFIKIFFRKPTYY